MGTIKSEDLDIEHLLYAMSGSRSTSSSSASSPVHSRAFRTPFTSPESQIAVKKEAEDVSPVPPSSRSKKRRPAPAPIEHDDDKEKLQRNVKVKRSQSPSVAIKFEPPADEDDKLKVLREEEEKKFKWPRLAAMQGVNLFRLEDLDERGAPFVVPPGSELDAGLQRMLEQANGGFKRCDLPGPQQETNWLLRSTRPARYLFDRATYNSNGNLACRAPGQAILAVEGVDEAEVYSKLAVWVLLRPQTTNIVEGEKWFPFGVYRTYWNGAAEPGEFDSLLLSPDEKEPMRDGWQKQKEVLEAHTFYAKGTLTEYGRWMYENTLIEKRKGPAEIGIQAPPTNDTEEQEIRAATRFCLSRNRGLNVGYTVYVYDGPITEEEIGDAVERRALRRKAEKLEMWNVKGKKLYRFTEEELGDSEEKLWVLREAVRLRMVGKKNKSELEEGIDPEQPGQPKAKAKARKSTAGKKKSTAVKSKAAGRGGNPVPPAPAPGQRVQRARRSVSTVYYGEDNVEEDDAGESDSANESGEGESNSEEGTEYEDDGDD